MFAPRISMDGRPLTKAGEGRGWGAHDGVDGPAERDFAGEYATKDRRYLMSDGQVKKRDFERYPQEIKAMIGLELFLGYMTAKPDNSG